MEKKSPSEEISCTMKNINNKTIDIPRLEKARNPGHRLGRTFLGFQDIPCESKGMGIPANLLTLHPIETNTINHEIRRPITRLDVWMCRERKGIPTAEFHQFSRPTINSTA
tara:strand:- start:94 stop:426 length:333 start_codon:yes stop_codon:yes gene_type:complete